MAKGGPLDQNCHRVHTIIFINLFGGYFCGQGSTVYCPKIPLSLQIRTEYREIEVHTYIRFQVVDLVQYAGMTRYLKITFLRKKMT